MNEVGDMLTSPVFWIGSVLIALIVNIFSNYINRLIDYVVKIVFHQQRETNARRVRERNELISRLLSTPEEFIILRIDILYWVLRSVLWLLGTIAIPTFISIFTAYTPFIFQLLSSLMALPGILIGMSRVFHYELKTRWGLSVLKEAREKQEGDILIGDGVQG